MLGQPFAYAQEEACTLDYELIFDLREGEFGSYNVWDTVTGQKDREERFRSGIVIDSGNTVVAGERYAYEDGPADLVLTEIDRRGRVAWEQVHVIKDFAGVIKILPAKDGIVVVGNTQVKGTSSVWLGFFDAQGVLKRQRHIAGTKGSSLVAHDVIVARDVAKGYVLAASSERRGPDRNIRSVLYFLGRDGQVLRDHAYAPGPENRILGLSPAGKDRLLTTGYIHGEDGRRAGWIMQIEQDGTIVWQRQYPRGSGAELSSAVDLLGRYVAVAGRVSPAGRGGLGAGWLMVVGMNDGDVGWQRYYRGERHEYEVRDMQATREGLISLLLQAGYAAGRGKAGDSVISGEGRDENFVRLLTVTPRGQVFISDEYYNGEGAEAWQMVSGPIGERILVGASRMVYKIENPPMGPPRQPERGVAEVKTDAVEPVVAAGDEEEIRTLEGWVAAATSPEPYEDPCLQPYDFLP